LPLLAYKPLSTTAKIRIKMTMDSSLSNPDKVVVTHLEWKALIDFESCTLSGIATYTFDRVNPSAKTLCLDTANLCIDGVTGHDDVPIPYTLHPLGKPHLGRMLEISLSPASTKVSIQYRTTKDCSALQWLPPSQTAGKKHPYLFTQCQAIHARSLLPCQDRPGVKVTYSAEITVPAWATCVMSGLAKDTFSIADEGMKTYGWNQPVPISSYLIAMAVGDIVKVDVSHRCAIWSEPSIVESAAYEFAQTEEFLRDAEQLAGMDYVWGRYDLLCLPPSFPYGGMENPCLTFVTPTLLAGDRSLADVVAHEIAHSWTGNLVTNATWEHFWLNEGWTTWFQRKIMARIHLDDLFLDFDSVGGYKDLQDSVNLQPEKYTCLIPKLGDSDPDDCFSSVPYEKGFNLLYSLEKRVGTPAFENFFQAYIAKFAYKTVTSDDFKHFFQEHFVGNEAIADFDWNAWYNEPGMPPEMPNFDGTHTRASEHLATLWIAVDRQGRMLPTTDVKSWSTMQVTSFLDTLLVEKTPLQVSTLAAMNKQYGFAESRNSEILFRYCQLAVAAEDESILPTVVRFITTQGRMKFVRPLYRSLFHSSMGKKLAVKTFLANKDFYHPICSKMVATDLCVKNRQGKRLWIAGAVMVGAVIGLALYRKRR
jgi:leukotriene-A4 hydrolase